ncbi:MAG: 5'-methylthioadenosine/adenosylhomocysteine nucleosidase [Oscillospiraceae bacterium]
MKTIGVIGAMPEEVILLKNKLSNVTEHKTAGLTVYEGQLHGKTVVLCQSGMGKVAAAGAAQVLITKFGIEAIINSGIAGNFSTEIGVGDVVLSKEITYHDAQISMIEKAYPFMSSYKGDENLLKAGQKACEETKTGYLLGKIATGDLFICEKEAKAKIKAFCDPDCVEMEGAAIAHIACKNDIPFVIIRAMSDNADEKAFENLVTKQFDTSEYCDKAADICELCIKYC